MNSTTRRSSAHASSACGPGGGDGEAEGGDGEGGGDGDGEAEGGGVVSGSKQLNEMGVSFPHPEQSHEHSFLSIEG